jgi:hypothetical protein
MKRIINGKIYDTDTAKQIARRDNGLYTNDCWYRSTELYKTPKGNYFCVTEQSRIEALSKAAAIEWANGCTTYVDNIQTEFELENA